MRVSLQDPRDIPDDALAVRQGRGAGRGELNIVDCEATELVVYVWGIKLPA